MAGVVSVANGSASRASALVATLERAWAAIVAQHGDVPDVVVVAPGSGGRELKGSPG